MDDSAVVQADVGGGRPFSILIVCYANLCRSPMAQVMLASRLRETFGPRSNDAWHVSSAGTRAVEDGMIMHADGYQALTELGYLDRGDGARQLTPTIIEQSDLILTAEREHRSVVVRLSPSAVQRTFTLRQFGRLCAAGRSASPDQAVRCGEDLLDLAHAGRPHLQHSEITDDEIPDPMGGGVEEFRSTAYLISQCIDQILGATPKAWGAALRSSSGRPA